MVNIDVEVDDVATIVSYGKGAEATRGGGKAIEGEELDNEREIKKRLVMGFRGGLGFKERLRSGLGFKEWEERERWRGEWVMRVEEESRKRSERNKRNKLSKGAIFLSSYFRIRVENGGSRRWR